MNEQEIFMTLSEKEKKRISVFCNILPVSHSTPLEWFSFNPTSSPESSRCIPPPAVLSVCSGGLHHRDLSCLWESTDEPGDKKTAAVLCLSLSLHAFICFPTPYLFCSTSGEDNGWETQWPVTAFLAVLKQQHTSPGCSLTGSKLNMSCLYTKRENFGFCYYNKQGEVYQYKSLGT